MLFGVAQRVPYTTNVIELLNYSLRKIIKGRGDLPHDDDIRKLLYLGLKRIEKMDDADPGRDSCTESVYYPVR